MPDQPLYELRTPPDHDTCVTVAPWAGGRIAQITIDGRSLLVDGDASSHPAMWGSFPMVPWAGRVRDGRFRFGGATYQLPTNLPPHAIHGTGFDRPWTLRHHDATSLSMGIDLDWPFGGRAEQRIHLGDRTLVCELSVHADALPMPAELGWHPWFRRPDRVEFAPTTRYVRDSDGIATGELVAHDPTDGPFDDCFVNTSPVVMAAGPLTVTLTSDCDHWVLYDEPEHATCVEPQSGPPDAFNQQPRQLEAGEELRRTFTLSW